MKSTKQYHRIQKYSKISTALKCRLLNCIYIKNMSIKSSAKLCKVNYSTAKSIIKNITPKQQIFISNEINYYKNKRLSGVTSSYIILPKIQKVRKTQSSECTFHQLIKVNSQDVQIEKINPQFRQIQVISTIGYDFFQEKSQHKQVQERKNYQNPFQIRKGFVSVIDLYNQKRTKELGKRQTQTDFIKIGCLVQNIMQQNS